MSEQDIQTELKAVYDKQWQSFTTRRVPLSYRERIDALDKFKEALIRYQEPFVQSISEDFGGRAREETLLLEIFVLLDEIRHTQRHLKKWMKPTSVMPNWQFLPSRAKYIYQPLGVVGVIGAWNYQLLLSLSPVIGAISAGNHVMMKPSEMAPRTADLMRKMVAETFPEDYVTVIMGETEVAKAFSSLPFHHLIFTGSTRVGKMIMRAASENLTPVTLELGGKSPAIISDDYAVDSAARKIIHGKLSNAGQTCVAPDYVLVPDHRQDEFIQAAAEVAATYYPKLVENPDYTRILSSRHYERLQSITDEVRDGGGRVEQVNAANEDCNGENKVFPPTIVANCPADSVALNEEIFGPILPVVSYKTLDEAIDYINARPRPLALYYFDDDRKRTQRMLNETIAGGVTLNGCIYHLPQNNLPFGGVGDSGMGAYHGHDGFHTFSKKKPVFMQSKLALTRFMRPPYGKLARFLIDFIINNRPSFKN